MNRPLLLSALVLTLTAAACAGEVGGVPPDPGGDGGTGNDWGSNTEVAAIFESYCASCHGSAWSSCWTAHDSASLLAGMIQSGAMPRNGPMAPADEATALSWLQGGAPCSGTEPDGGGGGPVPLGAGGPL